ncbi:hypothetical protein L2E82_48652 [Cichorium intybus]|uniref:Uncharacterized protein n=1 Tax=Cichorium intybus TaxID=13427 RepID=A0ACB8YYQ5_CICIN|nr:hypothetical protein L2E82_48652 [Cichorium intybus]
MDKASRSGGLKDVKLSFVGHSIGNVIIRIALSETIMELYHRYLHTNVSVSGPHLGYLYSLNSLFNSGLWLLKKLKTTRCIHQLTFTDDIDLENTFFYKLSKQKTLESFKNIILLSSPKVRLFSNFNNLTRDYSRKGKVFHDMLNNCLDQIRFPSSEQQMFMICDIRLGVSALEFDRQGIYLASVTRSGCLTVHDYESLYCRSNQHEDEGKQLLHISLSNSIDAVRWNPTNQDKVACTSLSHNEVHIFDIGYISSEPTEILRKRPTVTVHGSNVRKGLTDIALFNDGTRVLASDTCGARNIWDRRAGNFPQTGLTTNANSSLTSIQLNGDQTSQFLLPYSVLLSDNTMALEELYGNEEMTRKGDECLNRREEEIKTKSSKKAVDAEQSLLNRASSPQTGGNLKSMKDTKQDKDEKEGPTLKTAGPDGEITAEEKELSRLLKRKPLSDCADFGSNRRFKGRAEKEEALD